MEEPVDLATLCTTMLDANRDLFASGHIEAAYHALATALHLATDAGDAPTLHDIHGIAVEQHQQLASWIAAATGAWRQSVETARWASLERIYNSAIRQARTRALTVELRAKTDDSERDA
jgi:hypothetical protein